MLNLSQKELREKCHTRLQDELSKAQSDPTGRKIGDAGAKMDAGKDDYLTALQQFPKAIAMISEVCTFGAEIKQYGWNAWREVPDAQKRYTKAELRHMMQDGADDESGMTHYAHRAWCALAALELDLAEDENG